MIFFIPSCLSSFRLECTLPVHNYARYVGRRVEFPANYKMTKSGVFTRESVLDISQVEDRYGTPRAFNYYMGRKSSEEWEAEQQRDANGQAPINLLTIEQGVNMHDITKMTVFESGKADYRKMSDIELCTELDSLARSKYGKYSVYQLTLQEKQNIAEYFYRSRRLSEDQIRRCLILSK